MSGNELWRKTLERAREKFTAFEDALAANLEPQPHIVLVRSYPDRSPDYDRTIAFLKPAFDRRHGLGLATPHGESKFRTFMFALPYLTLYEEYTSNPPQWHVYHTLHPEGNRDNAVFAENWKLSQLRWNHLKSIFDSAGKAASESGLARDVIRVSDGDYAHNDWIRLLFSVSWDGVPGTGLQTCRRVVTPASSMGITCRWDPEEWKALRAHAGGDHSTWPDELPSSWFSILMDVLSRSVELCDWLLSQPVENASLAVRPIQTQEIAVWPPDDGWHFHSGKAAFRGVVFEIVGKPRLMLKRLADASTATPAVTWIELAEARSADGGDIVEQGTIKDDIKELRKLLRRVFECHTDPIPNVERGGNCSWRLDCGVLKPRNPVENQ